MSIKHFFKLIPARLRWHLAKSRSKRRYRADYTDISKTLEKKNARLIRAQRVSPEVKATHVLEGEVKQLKDILEKYGDR